MLCGAWWLQKLGWSQPVGQWDFRVYYYGAQAWRAGLNPYDPRVLPEDLYTGGWKFNYPPYALALFAPLTHLSVVRAMQLFLVVKLAALAWLLHIWNGLLRTRITEPAWVLFLMFAYSSAIFVDFVSGSVTTFEQLLVWMGVAALLGGRYWTFTAAIVAASLFRIAPLALLIVCLVAPDRRGYRYVAAGVGAFAAILLGTYAIAPALTSGFVRTLPTNFGERGWLNPAAWPLSIDLSTTIDRAYHVALPRTAIVALYLVIVVIVAVPTVLTIRRIAGTQATDRMEVIVYVAFLATALVLPRFKNYSYMLLIVPTYYIAMRSTRLRQAVPLLLLACLPVYSWITMPEHLALVASYSKWLIAFGAWGLYVYEIRGGALLAD
jgi:hypothetical protein